jgi:hypothetical protein
MSERRGKKRRPGWYWARWADSPWFVVQWDGRFWYVCGVETEQSGCDYEIGPRCEPPPRKTLDTKHHRR